MEFVIPRRSVTFHVHRDANRRVWFGVTDDRGTSHLPPSVTDWDPPPRWVRAQLTRPEWLGVDFYNVLLPERAPVIVLDALRQLPTRREGHPHTNGPVPLPVFVSAPPSGEHSDAPWAAVASDLLAGLGFNPDSIQTALLGPSALARPPFGLPLRVIAIGSAMWETASLLSNASGLRAHEAQLQHHGLEIGWVDTPNVSARLREKPTDIVFVGVEDADRVLAAVRRASPAAGLRPRLLVVTGESKFVPTLPALPGVSLLNVPLPTSGGREFAIELVLGVVHDLPVHEAVKSAIREVYGHVALSELIGPGVLPTLVATPESIHDLRMASAYAQLVREASEMLGRTGRRGREATEILEPDIVASMKDEILLSAKEDVLQVTAEDGAVLDAMARDVDAVRGDFGRESWGLWPMARAERSLEDARKAADRFARRLRPMIRDSKTGAGLQQGQDRKVEVRLARREHSPLMDDYFLRGPFVDSKVALRTGALYAIEVGIGQRWEPGQNLAPAGSPSVDAVLPPTPKGLLLDVVLFEGDFRLARGNRVQTVHLPPGAASEVATFEVNAPSSPEQGSFRVAVYYQDHMLQSIRFVARVGREEEVLSEGRAIEPTLEFARTERFTNLDKLKRKKRAVSIAVNQNGGSHTFMVKRRGEAKPIKISEATLGKQVRRFRAIMDGVVEAGSGNQDAVRELADIGYDLSRGITNRATKKLRQELRHLRGSSGETIQLVRLDQEYAFPWTIIYDWNRPEKLHGASPAPVCCGKVADGSCRHGPDDGVYCVKGFWGVRHVLEEFLSSDHLEDAVDEVGPTGEASLVALAIGTKTEYTDKLGDDLESSFGVALARIDDKVGLLDMLWNPARRPALCIVLGHLRTKRIVGEEDEPRILTGSKEGFLIANDVTDRNLKDGEWDQPRTVLFLMACESAATELAELNGFVSALSSTGSLAVAGTESEVLTSTASDFALSVTKVMGKQHQTIGEAVHRFRGRLMADCNPLAFAFTVFGSADVRLLR